MAKAVTADTDGQPGTPLRTPSAVYKPYANSLFIGPESFVKRTLREFSNSLSAPSSCGWWIRYSYVDAVVLVDETNMHQRHIPSATKRRDA